MLHEVLSKEACAKCRFCCVFRRQSLWEFPVLSLDFAEKYRKDFHGEEIIYLRQKENGTEYVIPDLRGKYQTDDSEEEVACPFLDEQKGCTLPEEDRPFDCKIWPLRYMRMEDGHDRVCLTPTCPEMNQAPEERLKELVNQGLGKAIADYAEEHPYMIKKYISGYPVLWEKQ